MTLPTVILTNAEMVIAGQVASMRLVSAIRDKRKPAHGIPAEEAWERGWEGCCGEMGLAKLTNRFWSGTVGRIDTGDVGELEVRMTTHANGRLVLHPTDKDNSIYVLATGHPPRLDYIGWCYGREGKKQRFWCDPTGKNRPAFFVPQKQLRPFPLPEGRNPQ